MPKRTSPNVMDEDDHKKRQMSKIEFLSQFCEDEELFVGKDDAAENALVIGLKASANTFANGAMITASSLALSLNNEDQLKLKEVIDALEDKSDFEFFSQLRVTKKTFDFILTHVQDQYTAVYRGGFVPLDPKSALCICLWYLGTKSPYKVIGEIFGIAPSTVFDCVKKIVNILCSLAEQFIRWPLADEVARIEKKFKSIGGVPGVVGTIGRCHIEIRNPNDKDTKYLNRVSTHSVLLVAVCDANKKFTYIDANLPGSTRDKDVFTATDLCTNIYVNPQSVFPSQHYHLLGNTLFGLSKYLLVPFTNKENMTVAEERYNKKLYKTLHVVENAFCLLKERFKRLKFIDCDIKRIPQIIKACCVLHNITSDVLKEQSFLLGEKSAEALEMPEVIRQEVNFLLDTEGIAKRDMMVSLL